MDMEVYTFYLDTFLLLNFYKDMFNDIRNEWS